MERSRCCSSSPCKLAPHAVNAEPASELCCFRAGSSQWDDKIYLQASPHPNTRNVPYIRSEMYISCFHPPSNQYSWFCFLVQSSGKGVCALSTGARRGRRCRAAGLCRTGGRRAGRKRNAPQRWVHTIWSDLREGSPPDCHLLPRRIYPSGFCLSIPMGNAAHPFADYPQFYSFFFLRHTGRL